MVSPSSLVQRLQVAELTTAERRVADVMLRHPDMLAFGTVAEVSAAAATGGATVMRLATKIGFYGFRELQDAAREELSRKLRPAAARVRLAGAGNDPVERALATEIANIQTSLGAVTAKNLRATSELLLRAARVAVIASDAATGVATDFAGQLSMVRPDVVHATGTAASLVRSLAWLSPKDVLFVVDIARYESAVVDIAQQCRSSRVPVISVSDSPLSPIAVDATQSFVVSTDGSGPFDSFTGVLCVTNLLVSACVTQRGIAASTHLDRLEETWSNLSALTEE